MSTTASPATKNEPCFRCGSDVVKKIDLGKRQGENVLIATLNLNWVPGKQGGAK